jgi:Ran GTPase-activating protein (RanGAP) involved in mRNA processing and transport
LHDPHPGIIVLANAIPDMRALSVLNLDDNALRLGGCKAICDALKANTTVTSLSMSDNGFQTKSAEAIAEMLGDNGTLSSLNLSSNNIGARWDAPNRNWVATPEGKNF